MVDDLFHVLYIFAFIRLLVIHKLLYLPIRCADFYSTQSKALLIAL